MTTKKHEVRTTIELPEDLWEALRIRAIQDRRSMKELVAEAIAEWLRRKEKENPS